MQCSGSVVNSIGGGEGSGNLEGKLILLREERKRTLSFVDRQLIGSTKYTLIDKSALHYLIVLGLVTVPLRTTYVEYEFQLIA